MQAMKAVLHDNFCNSCSNIKYNWHQFMKVFNIICGPLICGQFIKRHKWWFGSPHQGRFYILMMMGRECSRLDPSYQRHITFACTGCYQLHPHHRLSIITPDLSPVPIYQLERMNNLVSQELEHNVHIIVVQSYYTIESKGFGRN